LQMSRKHITLFVKQLPFLFHAFFLFVIINGCSTYQSVTGYFNTYYNAQQTFDEARGDMEKGTKRDVDSSYFVNYKPTAQVTTKFDKVIEKCSKIIQLYPQSNLVDDALLLIGKTYVYNDECESSTRKFEEFFETFPASELRFEAKLWYAKSEYFLHNSAHSRELLHELVAEAEQAGEDEIVLEALLLEGQILYESGEYEQALELYQRATAVSGDGYLRALAQYYAGKCYEHLKRPADAADAYRNVLEFKPDFLLQFRAKLHYGRMLAASEQYESALRVFDDLYDDATKPEEKAEIKFQTATTYVSMGDTATGFALYRMIDTTYKKTDAAAKAYYQRAVLFEQQYGDFHRARLFYEKAKGENPNSAVTLSANKKVDNFSRYFQRYDNLRRYDSLLHYALLPDSLKNKPAGHDSLRAMDSTKYTAVLQDTTKNGSGGFDVQSVVAGKDSIALSTPEDNDTQDRILTEKEAISVEEEEHREDTVQTIDEDEIPSSRRRGKIAAGEEPPKEEPPQVKTRANLPRLPQLSPDTLRYLINQERFELAGLLFLEFQYLDSAEHWYRKIIEDPVETPFKARSYYALAEIYRAKHDSTKVDSLYEELLNKYGETAFGKQIKKLLGMNVQPEEVDSGSIAYRTAEQKLNEGKTDEALKMFRNIPEQFPHSSVLPKTYYVIGWIYENLLVNNDSAAGWYASLTEKYPNTIYANAAMPKVAVKNDTTSLSKYIKIKEIPLLSKDTRGRGTQGTRTSTTTQPEEGAQPSRGRGRGKDIEEEEEEEPEDIPEPEDTKDIDDDNN
jgi:tetratricopeptide (TPR) repeat protein